MLALCFALACGQEEPLRVKGAPFVVFGETVELRAESTVKDATIVWRVADAPGGPLASVETKPSFDPRSFTVRGVDRLEVTSAGKTEGDVLLVASLERKGSRIAVVEHRLRVGPLLKVRAWCREVANAKGGTRRPEWIRDGKARSALQDEVNRLIRPLGIEVELAEGRAVKAPDAWFDREGRFHPVVLTDGERDKSPTLKELFRQDQPGGLNVYFVRDCHWVTVEPGFRRTVTDHALVGIGMKDGQVVLDDAGDAAALAHELGHAFSLDDLKEKGERERLMFSLRKDRLDALLTYGEMKDARVRVRLHQKAHAASR